MWNESVRDSLSENDRAAISAAHLLHPARHFNHPRDVVAATDIRTDEKRAILASWASDIFAIESVPALRLCPDTDKTVSYDEIMEALKMLDAEDAKQPTHGVFARFDNRGYQCRRLRHRRSGDLGLCNYRKGGRGPQLFKI
jgi:hypothetical protein